MNRHIISILISGIILLLCNSCDKNSFDKDYAPGLSSHYLHLSGDTIAFEANAQSLQYIQVSAENISWQFLNVPSWISVTPISGSGSETITIKATENTSQGNMRTGSLVLASVSDDFDFMQEIFVCQDAWEPNIYVSQEDLLFSYEASSMEIDVNANFHWDVSMSDSWLNAVPSEDRKTLTITVQENQLGTRRSAIVSIEGTIRKDIRVVQLPQVETERTFTIQGNEKKVSFKMKLVEHGTFTMGSSLGGSNEKPEHTVTLTKDYFMAETEVTQELWFAVMGESPKATDNKWKWNYADGLGDRYPAYFVSYNDCLNFITTLNAMTGEQFRLPTEAEWEFAARGGNKSQGYTFAGSNTLDEVGWYDGNCVRNEWVKYLKSPNELGLYDMSGNVCEWCSDWFGSYSSTSQVDPKGSSRGTYRVCRGGSWYYPAKDCRVFVRDGGTPQTVSNDMGFRLALPL